MSAAAHTDVSLWKRFIYSGNNNSTDPLVLGQLFFVNSFSLLAFLSVTVFGVINLFEQNYFTGISELIGGIVFLGNLLLLRFSKNLFFAKTVLLLSEGVLLLFLLSVGGIEKTGIYWFFTFPIATFFLMGRQKGIIWNLCLMIAILSVFILSTFGIISIVYTFIEIRQLLASLFMVCMLVYIYQRVIEKTQQELVKSEGQARRMMEITEQEKVRDEALIASIGEGMLVVDNTGALILMNTVAKKLFGVANNENIIGKHFSSFITMLDKKANPMPAHTRPLAITLLEGKVVKDEYFFLPKKGNAIPVAIVATPVIINNKIIGAISLFRDITEEKALDKAKTEFVALASHQLRTPISAISWFAEILLHGDSGTLTKEQQEQVMKIYQSNKRMTSMVDALLTVSQLEMGELSIKPQSINLAEFIHTILEDELNLALDKKIHSNEKYDQAIGKKIVDPDIIRIIFRNLIANAIKYTPTEGAITISLEKSQEGIIGKISDTGYGIPENQQQKIFTKLFRADNGKQKDTDGLGLGLYIAKSILEQIGGKIWFESEENKGSTFFVLLPKEGMKERTGENSLVVESETKS